MQSIFLTLAWIIFFTSLISPGLPHSFPSIWKTSFIIVIPKKRKSIDSRASFRPISLTSCVTKLFERIMRSRLLFFLKSDSILSPRQAGFLSGRSTLDQILYLSQSISDGFTIGFTKIFDSVWHLALFHKLISAGFLPCFAYLTQTFLSNRRACVVYQNRKSLFFEFVDVFRKDSSLALSYFLFSSMISLLLCLLPSAALFMLTIWPFGPPPILSPLRWRPHQQHSFDWSAGLNTGVFLSIRANVRPPSSQWIPIKLTSSPTTSYSTPGSVLIPLQLFLGSPSTALFPFPIMYLR